MMTVCDLFSGIGGFSLGLEATGGFRTIRFCEIDLYARRVLAHHWPEVPCHDDIRTLTGVVADVLCGGFPCQDISLSGSGAGLDGARSGLWFQYLRLIEEARPAWVIIENVPALRSRGLDTVLRGLAALGYDAEWLCLPAAAFGAPHRRDRIWVVAYPNRDTRDQRRLDYASEGAGGRHVDRSCVDAPVAYPNSQPEQQPSIVHDAAQLCRQEPRLDAGGRSELLADAYCPRLEIIIDRDAGELSSTIGTHDWAAEPDVGRVAYGIPSRVDRLKCLGNAIVPCIAYAIGRAILNAGVDNG